MLMRLVVTRGICTSPIKRLVTQANPARGTMVAMVGTLASCQPMPVLMIVAPACSISFASNTTSSQVSQAEQGVDEFPVVTLVEPDGRLVEDVEHAHQARPDLGGQPDTLRFATGECARAAVQAEISDADSFEERESLPDLLEHPSPDEPLPRAEIQFLQKLHGPDDGHATHLIDVLPADAHREVNGFSRAPWHAGHVRSAMYSSILERM